MISDAHVLPYLPRPPTKGYLRLGELCRIIAPHVPPFARQAHTAETPPKSLGGREEVSLSPACVIAPGLPQPGLRVPLIARAYSRRCVGPFSLAFYSHAGNVPETPYMKFSRFI